MELYQLRYFIKVAEELNFRRAARLLFISQPALSQQIRDLEKELGIRLLYRDNQKVLLLPAGERFYERAKKIVEDTDNLMLYMQTLREASLQGCRLRIGFDRDEDGLSSSVITEAIFKIKEQYPQIRVELKYFPFEQVQAALKNGEMDVGFFTLRNIDYEAFKYRKMILWEDSIGLAVHKSLTGTAEELLEKYPLIQLKEDRRWEGIIRKKAKQVYKNYQIKYVDSIMKSMDYVSIRDGVVPVILSQAKKEPNLRPLEIMEDSAEDKIIVAALWKNDTEWIDTLLGEIKG